MEPLQHILNISPYLAILLTLVMGFIIGKITIGGFSMGSIVGSLFVGIVVGLLGVDITPSIRWFFFGLFMYVVGYQGGYHLICTLKERKESILVVSVLMSLITMMTLSLACWLFDLELPMAIGIAAGSFVHPELVSVTTNAIELSPNLTHAAKTLALSEVSTGYRLTVIFGVLGPVLITTWLLPILMKRSLNQSNANQPIDTEQNIVKRIFEVNSDSTVVGKTIAQLNAPSIDIIFEVSQPHGGEPSTSDPKRISAGDFITITGRHNTLFYLDDNVLGTERACNSQIGVSEVSELMLINTPFLVGKSIHSVKTDINQHTQRDVCITHLLREDKALEITPDLILEKGDLLQIIGSSRDVQIVENRFGKRAHNVGINQALFGIGLLAAYLVSMWHLNVGGLYLHFSIGLSCLISGIGVGWLSHKNNPLALVSRSLLNGIRDLSLLIFIVVTGLYFGPHMAAAINARGIKVSLIGIAVVELSQFISFVIAYHVLNIKTPTKLMGYISGSQHSGLSMSVLHHERDIDSAIYPMAVSYIISSFLMLISVSLALSFISV